MPERQRRAELDALSSEAKAALLYTWRFWARPDQLAPVGDWLTWLALAGRGFGKTRMGAEWVRSLACGPSPLAAGQYRRIALVAETAADARDVLVEGDSGILACHPKAYRPMYEPSKRRLTWPNGAIATLYNGTEPDQLRGPQHDAAWCDELAKYAHAQETWDMLQFGLRLGINPRQLVTTTPRPIPLIKAILREDSTIATRGTTYDNMENLAEPFRKIIAKYEGTRLGRQELRAEILDDLPGALWTHDQIDQSRVSTFPDLQRVVVAIDPSGTKGKREGESDGGDDIGIIVAGLGVDGIGYILVDRSCNLSPEGWGRRAINAYRGNWHPDPDRVKADCIVGETNYGGDMVRYVIHSVDDKVPFKIVTATRGKAVRAEPVAALYEQGRIKHVGALPELEDQMCLMAPGGYEGEGSPDRLDAMVWAITELMVNDRLNYGMLRVVE